MEYAGIALGIIVVVCFTIAGTIQVINLWRNSNSCNRDSFLSGMASLVLAGFFLWFMPVSGNQFWVGSGAAYFSVTPIEPGDGYEGFGFYVTNRKTLETREVHDIRFIKAYTDNGLRCIINNKFNIFGHNVYTNYELRY